MPAKRRPSKSSGKVTRGASKKTAKTSGKVPAKKRSGKAAKKVARKKVARKKVAKKKVAKKKVAKKTAAKKATAKKSKQAVRKKKTSGSPPETAASAADRSEMIAKAAYLRAERRNFEDGDPVADWLASEKEVDELLDRGADHR